MSTQFVCDLNALTTEQRERHNQVSAALNQQVIETAEQPDGFAFRYPASALALAAQFIELERLCCPFFAFALTIAPQADSFWLSLTGAEGIKAFIRAELGMA
jgi:hypothetical protein